MKPFTRNWLHGFAAAGALALTVASASASADELAQNLGPVGPNEPILTRVGSKRVIAFYEANAFPPRYRGGAFIGQHGSWNRTRPSGYKVVFVPFANGAPSGMPENFLTGFLNERGQAMGRPVGVAVDRAGAVLVADDAGNVRPNRRPPGAGRADAGMYASAGLWAGRFSRGQARHHHRRDSGLGPLPR